MQIHVEITNGIMMI